MKNSQRVIQNTIFLYANMIVNICVQLAAVRLLLLSLGETDYGIYNVVAGTVALFAFMNAAMAAATQRFLSYEIGKMGDVKEVFYNSVILHLALGIIVFCTLELVGIYYVDNILSAPSNRIDAAKLLLHCITASTFINIITVPYEADINANEHMGAIAIINILDSLMKLGAAIYIGYTSYDKLNIYGILTMSTIITTLLLKRFYCLYNFEESHFKWHKIKNYTKMKEIAYFASWNFIGAGCSLGRYQGTAIILNSFFGIFINAAYGISQHVNSLLNFLSITLTRAIRPQIIKSAGCGDLGRMVRLSATTSKITSLMVALIAVPLYIEMPFVLHLWLGDEISNDTIMFCRCFMISTFIFQLSTGLQIALESVGKIRLVQIVLGTMHILPLPIAYICFKNGMPAVTIMECIIIEEIIGLFARVLIATRQAGINPRIILLNIALPCTLLTIVNTLVCTQVSNVIDNEWIDFIIITITSACITCITAYTLLLTKNERTIIANFVDNLLTTVKR